MRRDRTFVRGAVMAALALAGCTYMGSAKPRAASTPTCGAAKPDLTAIKSAEGLVIAPDGTIYFSQPFDSPQPTFLGRYRPPYDQAPDARWVDMGGNALGIVLDPQRNVLYAGSRKLRKMLKVTLTEPPTVETLADIEPDVNGVTLGEDHAVYYSDQKGGHIYRLAPDGTKSRVTVDPPLVQPNGVAFGPDGRLYVVSWSTNDVTRLTLTHEVETAREVFATLPENHGDGIAFDAKGLAYVTAKSILFRISVDGAVVAPLGPSNGANIEFGAGALSCADAYVAGNGQGIARYENDTRGADVPWHRR
jgi:sugar lactone lactonase YvrE